jgi:hypothetical protein
VLLRLLRRLVEITTCEGHNGRRDQESRGDGQRRCVLEGEPVPERIDGRVLVERRSLPQGRERRNERTEDVCQVGGDRRGPGDCECEPTPSARAPTMSASAPYSNASSSTAKAAAARWPSVTSIPAAAVATARAANVTSERSESVRNIAPAFSSATRRREMGFASSRSSVACSVLLLTGDRASPGADRGRDQKPRQL